MLPIYSILYSFAFILYLPVLLIGGKLHRGFIQRFGFLGQELTYRLSQKPNIWFHAVSVGEVLAIVALVDKIRAEHPGRQVVISTVTKTGHAIAQKRFKKEDIVVYAPLDLGWSVGQFIKAVKPEMFVVTETELWPNLLNALARIDVPIVMVNGRISDKSFYRYRRFSFLFQGVLRRFRGFCMQSAKDADRIIELGGLPKTVAVVGSMKFDDVISGEPVTKEQLGLPGDALVWVAGSTHLGEEKIVLDVFKKLKAKFNSLELIIAPRHIERTEEVCSIVTQSGYTARRFSSPRSVPSSDEVIVVDTIGNLKSLYRLAAVVFVGKSLLGSGGQNIIEPAFFGKPVIVGPNMQNFAEITDVFLAARAIVQVQEAGELEDAVYRLLSSAEARQALGERALMTIQKNQGATARTQKVLSQVLNTTQFVRPS
ncbi:MAG: 3-deoxy-D-manno-octulosonic acid transferase [Candidatus Omnitrophica bacterium]|nr:3-deoxy-D-manno-octulosonic acid transferase [Candidatus Omnitrophota bacterium]